MGEAVKSILVKDIQKVSDSITRPANTTTYAAGDALAEVTTNDHLTFTDVLKDSRKGNAGEIVMASCLVSSYVATGPAIDLMLFHTDVGEDADNAAASITDAEMANLIGVVSFASGDWVPGTATVGADGNQIQIVTDIKIPVQVTADRKIYGFPVMRNAYAPVASEIYTFTLGLRLD